MIPWDKPQDRFVESKLTRLMRYAVEEWTLMALFWRLMSLDPKILWHLWIICLVGRINALGVILHDACHNPGIKRTFAFSLFEMLMGSSSSTTWNAMKYRHLRCHSWNCSARDPYFVTILGKRLPAVSDLSFAGMPSRK